VLKAAAETGALVTAENHSVIGGLGSAVAEVIAENSLSVPFQRVGVRDQFGEVGGTSYLMERFQLTASDIAQAVKSCLKRRQIH